jgi:4-hydroxybenzoyl-CoA thioesterase
MKNEAMNTGKEITYTARVEFGDCDPAGIVWFPNFFPLDRCGLAPLLR